MQVDVVDKDLKKVGSVELPENVFGVEAKPHLWHELVRWQLAKKRRGTAKTKERAEVVGSTRKIYRQKGTGRARHGSKKAPLFVGGGTVFGPRVRSYDYALPRKVKKLALMSALSQKQRDGKFKIVEDLKLEELKTKQAVGMLSKFDLASAIVIDCDNDLFARAIRNVKSLKYLEPQGINVYDLMKFKGVIVTKKALEKIQEGLTNG